MLHVWTIGGLLGALGGGARTARTPQVRARVVHPPTPEVRAGPPELLAAKRISPNGERIARSGHTRATDCTRLPDDAAGPLCDGTRLGRWRNATDRRLEDAA